MDGGNLSESEDNARSLGAWPFAELVAGVVARFSARASVSASGRATADGRGGRRYAAPGENGRFPRRSHN